MVLLNITRAFLILAFLLPITTQALLAQDEDPPLSEEELLRQEREEKLSTLDSISASINAIREDIDQLEKDRQEKETEEEKAAISAEIESGTERIANLENDFTVLATGIDPRTFFEKAQQDFDWKEELSAVFAPAVAEIKQATSHPREVENLRSQLIFYEKRLPQIDQAIIDLEALREGAPEGEVTTRLSELSEYWQQQENEIRGQYEAAQQRLEEKEREKAGVGAAAGEILRLFFRDRGVNLLIALLAFGAIFAGLRYLHRLFHRMMPTSVGSHGRQLLFRLLDVVYYVFTVVVAIGALLVVLYLSSDWILLTIAVLVLIGLAWAARNAVPVFLDQGKLLLNVGPVREGERLIYGGVPFRVDLLSFYTDLVNPALQNGTIRLPIEDLIDLRSRPYNEDEPWFPSTVGDWVILDDGTYGEVVRQTLEVVVVSTVRGSLKAYSTVDYLAQHPKNLSANFFAVNHIVGLDYRYREIVNTEVVEKLKAKIEAGFRETFYGEHLNRVIVEFKEMSASSLDIITIVRFAGGAASEYTEIRWKLQQLALDCCNENGWEIPFPQLTVHRAEAAA